MKQIRYIYKITNPVNHIYIGKTDNYNRRMRQYKGGYGYKNQPALENSMNMYGFDNHYVEIIWSGECSVKEIYRLEKLFIKIYDSWKNGLNCTPGGKGIGSGEDHPFYGKKLTEEEKNKLRGPRPSVQGRNNPMYGMKGELHPLYGKKLTEQHKEKLRRPLTEDHKEKLRGPRPKIKGDKNHFYDKKHTDESLRKMSDNHHLKKGGIHPMLNKKHSEETKIKIAKSVKINTILIWNECKDKGCCNSRNTWHPFKKLKVLNQLNLPHWDAFILYTQFRLG